MSALDPLALPTSASRHAAAFSSPLWLAGGHLQTIVPALYLPKAPVRYRRERWDSPDGDFIDLDWVADQAVEPAPDNSVSVADITVAQRTAPVVEAAAPLLVLFHGLEGSSDSHYARALMHAAGARGWQAVVPHFRSCSGELNRGPRFYHSGDAAEIDWILRRLHAALPPGTPLFVAGVSLGGNALLRWLGENGSEAAQIVNAAAAVSAPVDLAAGGFALAHGFNRFYTQNFLKSLKLKCQAKLKQYPGLFDAQAMLAAPDLHTFDDIVTAPLHGFRDADDYWHRASSKPILPAIDVPTLLLNARNDPFLPATALPCAHEVSPAITLEQPTTGGHVGFTMASTNRHGAAPLNGAWLAQRLLSYFLSHQTQRSR